METRRLYENILPEVPTQLNSSRRLEAMAIVFLNRFNPTQKIGVNFRQRINGSIGIGQFGQRVGCCHGKHSHLRSVRRFDADMGILDDKTLGGRQSESLGREQKDVGCRLAVFDIVAADDRIEKGIQPGGLKNGIKV